MSWFNCTYTYSPSTIIKSAEVNQNFSDITTGINEAMPSGGIIIWSGSVASIPTGWYLCDGNNSTPDLRAKFVYGAGGAYAVNATGGEETHLLTGAESGEAGHNHTQDAHRHTMSSRTTGTGGSADAVNTATQVSVTNFPHTDYTTATNQAVEASNAANAHNNLPPYLCLAYIMKS